MISQESILPKMVGYVCFNTHSDVRKSKDNLVVQDILENRQILSDATNVQVDDGVIVIDSYKEVGDDEVKVRPRRNQKLSRRRRWEDCLLVIQILKDTIQL